MLTGPRPARCTRDAPRDARRRASSPARAPARDARDTPLARGHRARHVQPHRARAGVRAAARPPVSRNAAPAGRGRFSPRVPSLEPPPSLSENFLRPGERRVSLVPNREAARPTFVVFSDVFFLRAFFLHSTPLRPQASAASARRARTSPATPAVRRIARTNPPSAPSVAPSRARTRRRSRKSLRRRAARRRAARRWSRPASGTKPRRSRRRRSGRFPRARGVGSRRLRAQKAARGAAEAPNLPPRPRGGRSASAARR